MEEENIDSGHGAGDWELLRMFKRDLEKIPMLSREEEIEVARRARAGDQAAHDLLVESNLRFVIYVVRKHWHPGLPLMDMISEGCIALMNAARNFDPEQNARFISYAFPAIIHKIYATIRDHYRNKHYSLDDPVYDEGAITLKDLLPADGSSSLMLQVADKRRNGKAFRAASTSHGADETAESKQVRRALATLDEQELRIIMLHFWLGLDLHEIAAKHGLSRAHVARLQNNALRKMRWSMAGVFSVGQETTPELAGVAGM